MKRGIAIALLLCLPGIARAQASGKVVGLTAEAVALKAMAGVWEATVEIAPAKPGDAPMVSKGIETSSLICNGQWLITDFKSEFMGQPFQGHGILGYDTYKKKFVGTWVDSMVAGLGTSESTFDPKTRALLGTYAGPDETGKIVTMKSLVEWKGPDTRVYTLTPPTGPAMKITYTRRN